MADPVLEPHLTVHDCLRVLPVLTPDLPEESHKGKTCLSANQLCLFGVWTDVPGLYEFSMCSYVQCQQEISEIQGKFMVSVTVQCLCCSQIYQLSPQRNSVLCSGGEMFAGITVCSFNHRQTNIFPSDHLMQKTV